MSFGERLKNLRLESNMTQEDLSNKLNVSRAAVGRYENNERFPDKTILKKIADIFDVSTDYLLERTNCKSSKTSLNKAKYEENIVNDIRRRLILDGIITEEKGIPKEILNNIIDYGIEAAIKIAKLEKKLKICQCNNNKTLKKNFE